MGLTSLVEQVAHTEINIYLCLRYTGLLQSSRSICEQFGNKLVENKNFKIGFGRTFWISVKIMRLPKRFLRVLEK